MGSKLSSYPSSGFRHGPYLVRFRQAQMAGRTIEDMEVREATTPAYRARKGHGRYAVGTTRRNHGLPPFRLFCRGVTVLGGDGSDATTDKFNER